MNFRIFSSLISTIIIATILIVPAAAQYDFEGIPLTVHAQGAVNGDVLTFGKYGLNNPPYEIQFDLPAAPTYARTYTGVWGGTEKYTGWTELTINNLRKAKYVLNGDRDRNRDVYESGHGIYWIGYDTTDVLKKGSNVITVATSKNDPGNKLDGRVYGILVVAVVENPASGATQYWIAEGNENLHGEGWAGTNPTRHEETNITFPGADVQGLTRANLTVLLLAGGKGQPDYVQFNNRYLGTPVRNVSGFNVTDIGDEISFNADGGSGTESRYVDAETFHISPPSVQTSNTIRFSRGIDLDGDGVITTTGDSPEGEDYIHSVLAILATKKSGASPTIDLAIEKLDVSNAYNGDIATLTAEVRSYGVQPKVPVPLTFLVDGRVINTTKVTLHPSGITGVSVPWAATTGTYTMSAEVSAPGDSRSGNNAANNQVTIGIPPDLSISVGTPVHKDAAPVAGTTQAPLSLIPVVLGIGVMALLRRRGPGSAIVAFTLTVFLLAATAGLVAPAAAVPDVLEYSLPVQIANNGGSDAPQFVVSVYLDGEKIADKPVMDGIKAHSTASISIPVFTTPGSHELKIVADEAGLVKDPSRSNNLVQGRYEFPK